MEKGIIGIEQGRASFAYECAYEASKCSEIRSKYKSYVKKIPVYIKTNGLGQTFAFVKSKEENEKAYKQIYEDTEKWLRLKGLINSNDDLVKQIVESESFKYRQLTNEVISFFIWLRRFADGLIPDEDGGKDNG